MSKATELRKLNLPDLNAKLKEVARGLAFDKKQAVSSKIARHTIARIKTIIVEKELLEATI